MAAVGDAVRVSLDLPWLPVRRCARVRETVAVDDARVDADEDVMAHRRHLVSVAYRMLGTVAEAEDAVQETYLRWYRLSPEDRAAVAVPRAWLVRVAGRVCLDVLGSARARRERYVGPWLPEPVPTSAFTGTGSTAADPADRVALDDTVSQALLVVLEATTPAERVAFVLHDVFGVPFAEVAHLVGRSPAACRQLASSARRRVAGARAARVPRAAHDAAVRAFAAAARTGDLAALAAALDPAVVLRSDGGGVVTAARHPVRGAENVARLLLGIVRKHPGTEVHEQETPDGLGFVLRAAGRVVGVVTLDARDGRVSDVRITLNPQKLSLWG